MEGAAQPSPAIQQHRLSIHWITGRICHIQVTKDLVEQYISLSLPKELVEQTRQELWSSSFYGAMSSFSINVLISIRNMDLSLTIDKQVRADFVLTLQVRLYHIM